MFLQIKAFIIAWLFFNCYVVYAYPLPATTTTTTISPFLNLLNHHVYYYNNPLLNHQLTSSTIPLNFISPAVNSLHLSHEQLTQHFNHLHEQYVNNLFGSSDFNHHPFYHNIPMAMITTSTQSPLLITTSTTTTSPTPLLIDTFLSNDQKIINKKPKEKNELIKINKMNSNLSSSSLNFDELLKNSKLDEKEKEEFLQTFHKLIEKEIEKREKKKLIIKTTSTEINNETKNIADIDTTINNSNSNETIKVHGTKIINSDENNVNSKELLENLDVVSKAIEQFLDVEKERNINTPEKSLPLNEEEIENISRKEDDDEENNYKMNEQQEFDRFIKSKISTSTISTKTITTTTITTTTTTTTKTPKISIENNITPSTINILRRRLPPTRYNTEFERLAQDYQERLMMAAGGIEEDVFKILRNAKIALYSSSNSNNKKKH